MQEGSLRAKSRRNAGVGITGRQAQAGSLVGCVLGSNPALCTESQVGRVCKQVEDWMSLNMLKTWVLILLFFSSVHYSNYQIKIIQYSNVLVSMCICTCYMCSNFSRSLGSQVIQLQLHTLRLNMDMSWWLLWSDNKKSLCITVSCPPEQSKVLSWGLGWIINCERQGQIQSFQDKSRRITELYLERNARVPIP